MDQQTSEFQVQDPNRSPMTQKKRLIFSDSKYSTVTTTTMLNDQTTQVRDLALQCRSLQLALDATKKSCDQFLSIIHFKNEEIERLKKGERREDQLEVLAKQLEAEIRRIQATSEQTINEQVARRTQELHQQLQFQVSQTQHFQQKYNELVGQYNYLQQERERYVSVQLNHEQVQLEHRAFKEQADRIEMLSAENLRLKQEVNNAKIAQNGKYLNLEEQLHHARKEMLSVKQSFQHEQQLLREQFISSCTKVISLSIEIERLNTQLDQMENQSEYWKLQATQAQSKYSQDDMAISILQQEIKFLQQENQKMGHMIEQQKHHERTISNLERTLEATLKEKDDQIVEYEERIEQITEEIENELTVKWQMEIKDLEMKFTIERETYESQIKQLQSNIEELQYENNKLKNDLRRQQEHLQEQQREYNQLRRELDDTAPLSEYNAVKMSHDNLQSRSFALEQEIVQLKSRVHTQQQDIERLTKHLQTKELELSEYIQLMERKKGDLDVSQSEFDYLKQENNRLQQSLNQYHNEIKIKNQQLESLELDNETLRDQNDRLKRERREMEDTMQRRTHELNERISEFESLRKKYESQIESMNSSQSAPSKRMSIRRSIVQRQTMGGSMNMSFNDEQ